VYCKADLSVLYGVVRAVHGFDFRLVTNETFNKLRPVARMSCSDYTHVLYLIYIFALIVVAIVKGIYSRFVD